ncbi:hypothetical protein OEZ86_004023 [Tetradesmus obliquus]|nr:hypothetical protein OEZ86_004023 [Tetradesmus obliquus]
MLASQANRARQRLPEASAPVPGTGVVRCSRQGSMLAYAAGDIVSGYLTAKPKCHAPEYGVAASFPLPEPLADRSGCTVWHSLGTQTSTCHIISGSGNKGDGHTVCDEDLAKVLEGHQARGETMEVLGSMDLRRLDTLLSEDVQVLKIDVEGFELQGAEGLLQRHRVRYILAECNTDIVGHDSQIKYLQWFGSHGSRVSGKGFRGPSVPMEDIQAGSAKLDALNLYAVLVE